MGYSSRVFKYNKLILKLLFIKMMETVLVVEYFEIYFACMQLILKVHKS